MKGFVVGAGHEAQVFKDHLDRMEENVCRCGRTPSEVGEEFVSSEDESRTELSYALARVDEYIAPPIKKLIPIPVPTPAACCLGPTTTLPLMEEISEEQAFICDNLDGLLREADKGRARDLQEGSSQSVVHSPPRLGSERWRRLNEIHRMHPGPDRRDSSRRPRELWGPGKPGGASGSPSVELGAINTSLLRRNEGVPSSLVGRLGLVFQGEELVQTSGAELGLWICDPPEDWSV